MAELTDIEYRDRLIRVLEALALAPLTFLFCVMSLYPISRLQFGEPVVWVGVPGIWGLAALWWMIIAVNRSPGPARKIPFVVWLGLAAGTLSVAGSVLLFLTGPAPRGLEPVLLLCALFLLPVFILAERLSAWRKSGGVRNGA